MAGDKPAIRPVFDDENRARIRRGLNSYREQHGMGVPKLKDKIEEFIGDKDTDRIPFKSLQRFLAGTHRTEDALVANCEAFLMSVAPPPPEDILAESLGNFLLTESEHDYSSAIGSYYSFIITKEPETGKIDWTPYSLLTLEQAQSGNYLIATEEVHNIMRSSFAIGMGPKFFERSKTDVIHSGIYLHMQFANYMLFTRGYFHSRICMLHQTDLKGEETHCNLFGDALEPYGKIHAAANLRKDFEIRYFAKENAYSTLQELQKLHS